MTIIGEPLASVGACGTDLDDAKFRSLVHYAAALTMLVSPEGRVDSASGALARLLGQDPSDVLGEPLAALVEEADHLRLREALAASASGPSGAARAPVVEVRLRHKSAGSIPFELTIVNLLDEPTVQGFVVSAHDQTARKAIEDERAAPAQRRPRHVRRQAQRQARSETYRADMHATAVRRLHADADLRRGIDQHEIVPCYQPIVDLASGEVVAVEALARWMHPGRGLLSAEGFIGLAEEIGVIDAIGEAVLDRACHDLRQWIDTGSAGPDLGISVNLAPRQLEGDALSAMVVAALAANRLEPARLTLEITESALMRDTERAVGTLRRLRELGVKVAVDDFGTGYSSLSYLQRFPIDILKIDKSFTDQIDPESGHAALPEAIIALARALDLTSIAEGVESEWQRVRLVELGCHQAQGYRFAAPMAAESMVAMLERG